MEKWMTWVLVAAVAILVWHMKDLILPEKASQLKMAALNLTEGKPCSADKDCPCWGTYSYQAPNITVTGIGSADCKIPIGSTVGTCDTTWCYDIEPIGTWFKDEPWQWMKANPLVMLALVAIILVGIFGFKGR